MALQDSQPGSDGPPALIQGSQSRDKLYFVSYFSALFTGGMKNRWPIRAYVDLFTGPGLCIDQATEEEFHGSPMNALGCRTPFTHLYFNDLDPSFVEALRHRQERDYPRENVFYFDEDCNQAAASIAAQLPRRALVLAFIDPWTYEITFDGVASLAGDRSTGLIVTFQTSAIKRNAHQKMAAVDAFLDETKCQDRYFAAERDPSRSGTSVLIEIFRRGLRQRLGFRHFGKSEVIRYPNGAPTFYLLFASRHPPWA